MRPGVCNDERGFLGQHIAAQHPFPGLPVEVEVAMSTDAGIILLVKTQGAFHHNQIEAIVRQKLFGLRKKSCGIRSIQDGFSLILQDEVKTFLPWIMVGLDGSTHQMPGHHGLPGPEEHKVQMVVLRIPFDRVPCEFPHPGIPIDR